MGNNRNLPAVKNLWHDKKSDEQIRYIGKVGYKSPTGAFFMLHRYVIVTDPFLRESIPNVQL